MPILTVNIADKGARLANGQVSGYGHMWFALSNGEKTDSYGFAPIQHGSPLTAGQIYYNDSLNYQDTIYKKSFYITFKEYDILKSFGENPTSKQFNLYYNGVANSCVDFTYKALSLISENVGNYQGEFLPASNVNSKLKAILNEVEIRNANDVIPDTTGSIAISTAVSALFSCFVAGTPVLMADGTQMPIEQIKPGDRVMAFDAAAEGGRGANVPRPVTKTFTNEARQIVDLRGLLCTPGHVFLTGETDHLGRGVFKTIAAILKEDGTMVEADGSVVRARTGAKLGSIEDTPIHVAYRDPETGAEPVVLLRAGVPAITVHRLPKRGGWQHQSWSLAQWSAKHGVDVLLDGTLRAADGFLYGASDWPEGPTPLDTRETQNWVVRTADGQPYTPPWIADLIEAQESSFRKVMAEA